MGVAAFPNGQASIRTLVVASTATRCREESKVRGKGRPCILISALSGEARAGARSQWPKDWSWVRTEKGVEVAPVGGAIHAACRFDKLTAGGSASICASSRSDLV